MKSHNSSAWESEYRNPQFLTLGIEPLGAVKDFLRFIKKQTRVHAEQFSQPISDWSVLDLGCGNGKNVKYIVENYCKLGIGYDISETAIKQARDLCNGLQVKLEVRSIGEPYPIDDSSIDIIIDATSSNSLSESERSVYLSEMNRVLKDSGFIFVRALCLDGDANAKKLIKEFPGSEQGTYTLPSIGVTEYVFSKKEFTDSYSKYFEIIKLEKTSGYQKWGNQSYKRNYWVAYLRKK